MQFTAKIIEDSIYNESRLTTFQLVYPRFVHAEFMTHRVFSRNASSSRAIPVEKMITMVENNPAMPVHWGLNQKGMQADQELSPEMAIEARNMWLDAAHCAAHVAKQMVAIGLHKQVANRILEPFQWINVVMTSNFMENFWELRCHKDADPNIEKLARMMKDAYDKHQPKKLGADEFHLPYVHAEEKEKFKYEDLIKFSVARCARVSYLTHDNEHPKPENDIALYDRLVGARPFHASPTEHQARAYFETDYINNVFSGNFGQNWLQYRKFLERGLAENFYTL